MPVGSVFERRIGNHHVRERATDFSLIDDELGEVQIVVADARIVRSSGDPWGPSACAVRVGARVEVLGRKTRVVDAMQSERLERQEPIRMGVTGSRDLPLVLIPLAPATITVGGERLRPECRRVLQDSAGVGS